MARSRRAASPTRLALARLSEGSIDGAWWPHSALIAAELPDLVGALHRILGEVVDIQINWSATEGQLDLDGLPGLLGIRQPPEQLMTRWLKLGAAYLRLKATGPFDEEQDPAAELGAALSAFLQLGRRAVLMWVEQGATRPMIRALEALESFTIAGFPYEGLRIRPLGKEASSGLLPVSPADIVGNEEYLEAGLRLARDVAGYDFELGRNPKRINPGLFGLG
uniref:DUF5994 family protein n=1 Tax=Mycolicibacterium poriferae TaxID=39694 RepID=UPI0032174D56